MSSFAFSVLSEFDKQLPFYLIGAGHQYEQEDNSRPFGYPYYQWIQTEQGAGKLVLDDEEALLAGTTGMLLLPEVPHKYYAVSEEPWIVSWITFGGFHLNRFLKTLGFASSGTFSIQDDNILQEMIFEALEQIQSTNTMKGLDSSALIYRFLVNLYKYAHGPGAVSSNIQHSRLHPVVTYIERNYDKEISIEDLSDILDVSPQHFCLLFKKTLQTRPFEYLNSFRINKSKQLLVQDPEMKINEIARAVGYSNESYFSSLFKKKEGLSPRQFRRLNL